MCTYILLFVCSPYSMGLLDPSTSDGRVIFFLPWRGITIAGTTDAPTDITFTPYPREHDVQFILQEIRNYLSKELSGEYYTYFNALPVTHAVTGCMLKAQQQHVLMYILYVRICPLHAYVVGRCIHAYMHMYVYLYVHCTVYVHTYVYRVLCSIAEFVRISVACCLCVCVCVCVCVCTLLIFVVAYAGCIVQYMYLSVHTYVCTHLRMYVHTYVPTLTHTSLLRSSSWRCTSCVEWYSSASLGSQQRHRHTIHRTQSHHRRE